VTVLGQRFKDAEEHILQGSLDSSLPVSGYTTADGLDKLKLETLSRITKDAAFE